MKKSRLKSFVIGFFFVVGTFISGYLMLYAAINVKVALNDQMNTYANPVHPLASAWSTFGHVKSPFVNIGWVGDIAPANKENEKDPSLLFAHVTDILSTPDIMIGNLEGTLSENGSPKCDNTKPNCYTFAGSNALATSLKDAGFDVLNLANNHSYDFGPTGFDETKKILESLSIVPAGGRHDIRYMYWNGKTIAFVGASSYYWTPSFLETNEFIAHIKEAKEKADVVIVLFHGGGEGAGYAHTPDKEEWYIGENRGDLRMMARRAIDEGASVVLGSGPHVLRGIEFYKEHLIAYSLGNFAFSGTHTISQKDTLGTSALLNFTLDDTGVFINGHITPITISTDGTPLIDESASGITLIQSLSQEDFGPSGAHIDSDGTIKIPAN